MTEGLFPIDEIPEVPLLPAPRARKGAARGSHLDARFLNDYPPSWDRCASCGGGGMMLKARGVEKLERTEAPPRDGRLWNPVTCPDCLGMGNLKGMVRLQAGHRCIRCLHPYMPAGDARMLGVEPSGIHDCETCDGSGLFNFATEPCPDCDGAGRLWTPWSACGKRCTHDGPVRALADEEIGWEEFNGPYNIAGVLSAGVPVEAIYRILTVHHLDGDKANVRWWNLVALCQRCHLEIQSKIVMERVYPWEHSEWFKPYVAGYYAKVYLGEDVTRMQALDRLDELLALERMA